MAILKIHPNIHRQIRDVAVKVQHPNILEETYCDVDLLFNIISLSDKLAIPMKKEDFTLVLQRQTNFEWEAYNLRKFSRNFRDEIREGIIKFPDVSVDLLSPSVLVESWANGRTISNFYSSLEGGISDVGEGLVTSAKQVTLGSSKNVFMSFIHYSCTSPSFRKLWRMQSTTQSGIWHKRYLA